VINHRGVYYILYSGGSANSEHKAIGYATATSPVGPFARHRGNPIMRGAEGVFGLGHPSTVRDRGVRRQSAISTRASGSSGLRRTAREKR
jgi:beta-xylosidase